jgi:hypothetical protein
MCGENSVIVCRLFSMDSEILCYVQRKMLLHCHIDTLSKLENVTDKLCFVTTSLCPRHWLTSWIYTSHMRVISWSFKPVCFLTDLRQIETLGISDLVISQLFARLRTGRWECCLLVSERHSRNGEQHGLCSAPDLVAMSNEVGTVGCKKERSIQVLTIGLCILLRVYRPIM